jgi:hypothetical protein
MYKCKYCGKECKNKNSLAQHEIRCRLNPDKLEIKSNFSKYNNNLRLGLITKTNTNQYVKAKNLGLPKPEISEKTREKFAKIWRGRKHTEEEKQKISSSMKKAVRERPESYSASNINGRVKKVEYNGLVFDSSWEVIVAKFLDDNNIIWERPKNGFEYFWENDIHLYYPDFYIPSLDLYIEVKGYKRNRDEYKWKSVSNLVVIKQKEINAINKGIYILGL